MATETTNYHLIKPGDTDPVDNTPLNQNFDSIDAAIADHVADTNNPHQITKEQVGLGNVDNVATKDAIAELIDNGAKNLIQNVATSRTENGVTFTVNADGTVSLTGTASATIWFPIMTNMSIDSGTYTVSNGLADDTARVIISTTNSISSRIFDSNESGYITKTIDAISGVNAYLRVASGKVTDGTVVKPMLCTAEGYAISPEFVPYAPTNRELYDVVQAKITKSEVYNRGTAISTGDDLNNYTTFGKFYAATGAIATSLTNCPITTGFVMTVEESFQAGKMQTLVTIESGGNATVTYRRSQVYRSSVWSWLPWYKFEGTALT